MARPLFLYNTASRSVEPLIPREPDVVRIYTCGPTVYGEPHIGNYRTYIFEDVLVKSLRHFGYTVDRVMNVTDVGELTADDQEDKMELGARREQMSVQEVAQKYEKSFVEGLRALHIEVPDRMVRATETIPEQINLIQRLEAGGHTYQLADGVYFDSTTFVHYGEMARLNLEGQQAGARVAMEEGKRHATDFALWKFSPADKTREMEWESPWGKGFPGWHIECSAIALTTLGDELDIHCGGADHIPIHHTNEIAQSEAATGKPFSRVWSHGEFLLMDGGKMSKSLGNLYTLSDLTERGIDPLDFRFFCYTASYRAKLNFTWEAMESAKVTLTRLRGLIQNLPEQAGDFPQENFEKALADDLNMPAVIALLWEALRSPWSGEQKRGLVRWLEPVLSLDLERPVADLHIPEEVHALVDQRQQARKNKDWALADQLRAQIEQAGFGLIDKEEATLLTNLRN